MKNKTNMKVVFFKMVILTTGIAALENSTKVSLFMSFKTQLNSYHFAKKM